jgi:hypothetical protein
MLRKQNSSCDHVNEPLDSIEEDNFFTSCANISFSEEYCLMEIIVK